MPCLPFSTRAAKRQHVPELLLPPDVREPVELAITKALHAAVAEMGEGGPSVPAVLLSVAWKLAAHAQAHQKAQAQKTWRRASKQGLAMKRLHLMNKHGDMRTNSSSSGSAKRTCSFELGERILVATSGTLADAVIMRHVKGSTYGVRIHATKAVEMELHTVGCCKQRFATSAEYSHAVFEFVEKQAEKFSKVEDGITGIELEIEKQTLLITTENEHGTSSGTFTDLTTGKVLANGSIFELRLRGAHEGVEGKRFVANGPFHHKSDHPEDVYESTHYQNKLLASGIPVKVKLEGPPTNCRLRIMCETDDMYMEADTNLADRHGTFHLHMFAPIINGKRIKRLSEHIRKFTFNPDGTISLCSFSVDSLGRKEPAHGISGNPAEWVVGYGYGKHDQHEKHFQWVPAKDPRRLVWAFRYEPAVEGVQRAEWLSVKNVTELVPLLLRESAGRDRGQHDWQPLLFRAGPGSGKTWSMLQLYYLLCKQCTTRRPTDGVPLVPLLIVVQKLARLMRRHQAAGGGGNGGSKPDYGDLLEFYVRHEYGAQAQNVILQAHEMRACVVLFDGIDEASDLKSQIEDYIVNELAPNGVRVVATSRPEGVQAHLYQSGWVVMNLSTLTHEQQHRAVSFQLKGDTFFDQLVLVTRMRTENDRLYDRIFTRDEQTYLSELQVRNKLVLANAPEGAREDPLDGEVYDPSMRQLALDGQRIVAAKGVGASLESQYLTSLDRQLSEGSVMAEIEALSLDAADEPKPTAGGAIEALDTAAGSIAVRLAKWLKIKRGDDGNGKWTAAALWSHITSRTDEIFLVAETLEPVFRTALKELAESCGKVTFGPLKDPVRLCEKAEYDYSQRFDDGELAEACVQDMLRATIICSTGADYTKLIDTLNRDHYDCNHDWQPARLELTKMNNRFHRQDPTHHRFINVFMMLTWKGLRMSVEVQVHQSLLYDWSHHLDSHAMYEYFRSLFKGEYTTAMEDTIDRAITFFEEVRGVPVLLSMLVLILRQRQQASSEVSAKDALPDDAKALYSMAIRCALSQVPNSASDNMLKRIATLAHLNTSRQFDSSLVERALDGHDEELALWKQLHRDAKTEDSGVPLVKTLDMGADGSGLWQFKHLSFQESLFTRSLVENGAQGATFWEVPLEVRINDPFYLNAFNIGERALGSLMQQHFGEVLRLLPRGLGVLKRCLPDGTVEQNTTVKLLKLDNLNLDLEDKFTMRMLRAFENVEKLSLMQNRIGAAGLLNLINLSVHDGALSKLRHLNIDHQPTLSGRANWEPIADGIAQGAFPELRVLSLTRNHMGGGLVPLSNALARAPSVALRQLQILHIGHENDLEDDHLVAFADALVSGALPELQRLNVMENEGLGEVGFSALFNAARGEKVLDKLTDLEVWRTAMNDAALMTLGDVFAAGHLAALQRFCLHSKIDPDYVTDKGAITVLRGIDKARHENFCDCIFYNFPKITDATVTVLLELMRDSKTPCWRGLREISFAYSSVSSAGIEGILSEISSSSRTYPRLRVIHNPGFKVAITDEVIFALAKAITKGVLPRLKVVNIYDNFISAKGQEALKKAKELRSVNDEGQTLSIQCWPTPPGETAAAASLTGRQDPSVHGGETPVDPGAVGEPLRMLIGTLNFLGDEQNPFQFAPPHKDVPVQSAWEEALAKAKKAYNSLTIADAVSLVSDGRVVSEIVSKGLEQFVSDQKLSDHTSCAEFFLRPSSIKEKLLNLDNHVDWGPSSGRHNPIVFALRDYGDGLHHWRAAGADFGGYCKKIIEFYANKYFSDCVPLDAYKAKQWASLLLFDLQCAHAVNSARDAFEVLARASYLLDRSDGAAISAGARMHHMITPLTNVLAQQPDEVVSVIGCQELSADAKSMASLRSALPKRMQVYMRSAGQGALLDAAHCGFIYSASITLKDVTDALVDDCRALLRDLNVKDNVADTTCRKLLIAVVELEDGRSIGVVNLHCKSFGKEGANQLGDFVAGVRALTAKKYPKAAEVLVIGDTNLESVWPNKVTYAAQRKEIEAAPVGTMPKMLQAGSPSQFSARLTDCGLRPLPSISHFTTLKMRMPFQGQPEKTDELNCADKDFVILPEKGRLSVLETIVGGRPTGVASNMDLLMPNRQWPCDHFAVLCVMELDAAAGGGGAAGGAAKAGGLVSAKAGGLVSASAPEPATRAAEEMSASAPLEDLDPMEA